MKKTSLRVLSNNNQLFIGIALGIFLGLCISLFDDDYFLTVNIQTPDPFFNFLPIQFTTNQKTNKQQPQQQQQSLNLRCIVLLNSGQKPEKDFSAIVDTWGNDCNELMFFTDSVTLQQRYSDQLNNSSHIYLFQGSLLNINEWPIVRYILHYVGNKTTINVVDKNKDKQWTIISNGKSYIHTRNLRDLLERIDEGVPLIIGSRQSKINLFHSLFSNLFPFVGISSTEWPMSATISTDVPIIFNYRSFNTINKLCGLQSIKNIEASWWEKIISFYKIYGQGVPQHTGRTIGGCAVQMGIALLDPLDEESRPLIVKRNLRAIFSKSEQVQNTKSQKQIVSSNINASIPQISKCCSDRAIAFGLLNHKDQRLIDFTVRRLKVFGSD